MLLLPDHGIALLSLALGAFGTVLGDKILVSSPQSVLDIDAGLDKLLKGLQRRQVVLRRVVVLVMAAHFDCVGACKRNPDGN